jgi:hypothetical protein
MDMTFHFFPFFEYRCSKLPAAPQLLPLAFFIGKKST